MQQTERLSIEFLEGLGWYVRSTSWFDRALGYNRDLWNFADLMAWKNGATLIVQATSVGNVSARVKKIKANDTAREWVAGGNHIEVHGWRKDNGKWTTRDAKIIVVREFD